MDRIDAKRDNEWQQDRRRQDDRVEQRLVDPAPVELAVDEEADEQAVDRGDDGRLGRREHAAVDAAQHDDRREQRPARLEHGAQEPLAARSLAPAHEAVAPA